MYQDIRFNTHREFEELLENLPIINSGSTATCYQLNSKQVLRYFNPEFEKEYTREELLKFASQTIPCCCFNTGVVEVGGRIEATILPYVPGKRIAQMNISSYCYDDIVSACSEVQDSIQKLSELKQLRLDIGTDNMILYKNHIVIIDPMEYEAYDIPTRALQSVNTMYFSVNLFEKMVTSNTAIQSFVSASPSIRRYQEDSAILENPSTYLKEVKRQLNEYCGFEINSLEEATKVLKKTKKK